MHNETAMQSGNGAMAGQDGWEERGNALVRQFEFPSFPAAILS